MQSFMKLNWKTFLLEKYTLFGLQFYGMEEIDKVDLGKGY